MPKALQQREGVEVATESTPLISDMNVQQLPHQATPTASLHTASQTSFWGRFYVKPTLRTVVIMAILLTTSLGSVFFIWTFLTSSPQYLVPVAACPSSCICQPREGYPSEIVIDCANRDLSSVPTDSIPSDATVLDLRYNRLAQIDANVLTPDTFGQIREIYLQGNQISSIAQGAFAGLQLKKLRLNDNMLTSVSTRAFEQIEGPCVSEDIVYNRITDVINGHWVVRNLTEVEWPCLIDLTANPLTMVEAGAFSGTRNMSIYLGNADQVLTIQPSAFASTTDMHMIMIRDIPSLVLNRGAFAEMKNIDWISIDSTRTSLPEYPFGQTSTTRLSWFRIANTVVDQIHPSSLTLTMRINQDCYYRTYPYGKILSRSRSTIKKGGIELVSNTLPQLPGSLIARSEIAGLHFYGNTIAGFRREVFQRPAGSNQLCRLDLHSNTFGILPAQTFSRMQGVVFVTIINNEFQEISGSAFHSVNDIGSISIKIPSNNVVKQFIVKSDAFDHVTGLGAFSISCGAMSREKPENPDLNLEPFAFRGLRVDYMAVNTYRYISEFRNDLFTGLVVLQQLHLRPENLTRIHSRAFGLPGQSDIARLQVDFLQSIPCDCETAQLYQNLKENVKVISGLTCTAPFDDGTISHSWNLDHATCGASCLSVSLTTLALLVLAMILNEC